ncbi:peptide methionine sulfoxide reductase MsrA [Zopfochytrium polystomum]|nr:peptide methionine sulfoxide reductase MsrA [Zopfochytrium polystomum]
MTTRAAAPAAAAPPAATAAGAVGTTMTTAEQQPQETATLACGRFWGIERAFRKAFGSLVVDPQVGMARGYVQTASETPSSSSSSSSSSSTKRRKHRGVRTEAFQFRFDPSQLPYETILDLFFRIHDPTQTGRQGQHFGPQFRSAVFAHTRAQRAAAEDFIARVVQPRWRSLRVHTAVEDFATFEPSPFDDDFDYYGQPGRVGTCLWDGAERSWDEIEKAARLAGGEPMEVDDGGRAYDDDDDDEDVEPEIGGWYRGPEYDDGDDFDGIDGCEVHEVKREDARARLAQSEGNGHQGEETLGLRFISTDPEVVFADYMERLEVWYAKFGVETNDALRSTIRSGLFDSIKRQCYEEQRKWEADTESEDEDSDGGDDDGDETDRDGWGGKEAMRVPRNGGTAAGTAAAAAGPAMVMRSEDDGDKFVYL